MKVDKASQLRFNNNYQKKYNKTPRINAGADTVSFTGKYITKKNVAESAKNAFMIALSAIFGFFGGKLANSEAPKTYETTTPQTSQSEYTNPTVKPTQLSDTEATQNTTTPTTKTTDKLEEDYDFQLNQTKDGPSLTFDFTDNFKN